MPSTATAQVIQERDVLRHIDAQTKGGARPRAEAISTNVFGTRLLFSPHWNKELRLPSRPFQRFVQLLAVPLANPRVPDSLTAKIKIARFSETRILAGFAKICTWENYQLYGRLQVPRCMTFHEYASAAPHSVKTCVRRKLSTMYADTVKLTGLSSFQKH